MKSDVDPTGQRRNRRKTTKRFAKRLAAAKSKVLTRFEAIQYTTKSETPIQNKEGVVFKYDITPEQLDQLRKDIERTLNQELLESTDLTMPPDWWYKVDLEQPYREGTIEETNRFNRLVEAAIALGILAKFRMPPQKVPVEVALSSRAYIAGKAAQYTQSFSNVAGLSSTTSTQVFRVISSGIKAGLPRGEIKTQIRERFNVSESAAKRIAETEINRAYNDAKMDSVTENADRTGLQAGVIHISALLPTTRTGHADRHGNAYTVSDQTAWWNENSNRINCHCSVESVLIDKNGLIVDE